VKMLHGEGLTQRLVGDGVDPLGPQAGMAIPGGSEVDRLAIGRPGRLVFDISFRDFDPVALGNRFRPIGRRNGDLPAIGLNPCCKTDPATIGGEATVKQIISGVLQ